MYITCLNCGKTFVGEEAYNCPFCSSIELTMDERQLVDN